MSVKNLMNMCLSGTKTSLLFKNNLIVKNRIQYYARWAHRRPVKVFNHDDEEQVPKDSIDKLNIERHISRQNTAEYEEIDLTSDYNRTASTREPRFSLKSRKHGARTDEIVQWPVDGVLHSMETAKNEPKSDEMRAQKRLESAAKLGIPPFTKLSDSDPKISDIMMLVKSRKKREKSNQIIVEGKRLIQDCIKAGFLPEILFFSQVEDVKFLSLPSTGIQLFKMSYKTLSLWSDLTTSPGILGIYNTPPVHLKVPAENVLPVTIIGDNIREPGNLGSVLRVAAGVGCQRLILTKGCVDLWEPKVLRAGMGAHFRLQIHRGVAWEEMDKLLEQEAPVFLADSSWKKDGNFVTMPYYEADLALPRQSILVIGGETEGLSRASYDLAASHGGCRLHIPLDNGVESLNVATSLAVITFEMKRQRGEESRNKLAVPSA